MSQALLDFLLKILPKNKAGTTLLLVAIAVAPYVHEWGTSLYIAYRAEQERELVEKLAQQRDLEKNKIEDRIRWSLGYVQQTEWAKKALILVAKNLDKLDFQEPMYSSVIFEAIDEGESPPSIHWIWELLDKPYMQLVQDLRRSGCVWLVRKEMSKTSKLYGIYTASGVESALVCQLLTSNEQFFYSSFTSMYDSRPDSETLSYYTRKVQSLKILLRQRERTENESISRTHKSDGN